MRDYEVVYILQPDLEESALKGVMEKISGWITDSGGTVSKVDTWGKKHMAYAIRKQREGYYVLMNVKMAPSYARELERNLQFLEPVMRFLVTTAE